MDLRKAAAIVLDFAFGELLGERRSLSEHGSLPVDDVDCDDEDEGDADCCC